MLKKFEDKHNQVEMTTPMGDSVQTEEKQQPPMVLNVPYRGKKGETHLKNLQHTI